MFSKSLSPAFDAVRILAGGAAVACGQVAGRISHIPQSDVPGTVRNFVKKTDACTAPGWLSVRRPVTFMAGHKKALGTELLVSFETMCRAATGWLSARASQIFLDSQNHVLGTVRGFAKNTDDCTASGWLLARHPVTFMAGHKKALGTELLVSFETMCRAASGWLSARPSQIFPDSPHRAHGAAGAVQDPLSFSLQARCDSARVAADFSDLPSPGSYHLPVFPAETTAWMEAAEGKFIIDGTLGGGGHSEIFLSAGADVLGVDRDPEALAHARERLRGFGDRFTTWEGNFSQIPNIPAIVDGRKADGLLLDLGVSSRQLDSAVRGFSFMREGPLDMRMGPSSPYTAAEIVNEWPESEIVRILFEFGEEPKARRIAGAIVKQRGIRPFETTLELANCIEAAVGRHGRTHPATRAFQAIRMAANEELESLALALQSASSILKPGGRLLIITFHSLEDRMVKRFLRHRSTPFVDDPGWPEPRPNPDFQYQLLARKAILPTAEETTLNPRARSAKLRVARLLAPNPEP